MMRRAAVFFVFFAPFGLAVMAGPLALLHSGSAPDTRGVYLVVSLDPVASAQALGRLGLKPLGPDAAPFARFVEASLQQRSRALDAGYLLVSANQLAAICGFSPEERAL